MFKSDLIVRKKSNDDNDDIWVVCSPLIYESEILEKSIIIPVGFETNFASVPRIPFVYDLAGGTANEAAVVHDYLYTYHDITKTRAVADSILLEASKSTNVHVIRRYIMWAAVRVFGESNWNC